MAASKEVAKTVKAGTALASTHDYGELAGAGFEDQDSSHVAVPFLNLLQSQSPQVLENNPDGARAGMIMNSVTLDLYDGKEGVELIPAAIEHCYVEWVPKDKGGGGGQGFVGVHSLKSDVVVHAKENAEDQRKLKHGDNDLVETFYVYGVITDRAGDILGLGIVAFTSTKIKVYKGWSTKVNLFAHKKFGYAAKPPLFAHRILLTSFLDKNTKGSFFNFAMAPAAGGVVSESLLAPDDERFQAAVGLRDMVKGGLARAAFETQDGVTSGGDSAGEGEVPF